MELRENKIKLLAKADTQTNAIAQEVLTSYSRKIKPRALVFKAQDKDFEKIKN